MAASVEEEGIEPGRSRPEQPGYFVCNFELLTSGMDTFSAGIKKTRKETLCF